MYHATKDLGAALQTSFLAHWYGETQPEFFPFHVLIPHDDKARLRRIGHASLTNRSHLAIIARGDEIGFDDCHSHEDGFRSSESITCI